MTDIETRLAALENRSSSPPEPIDVVSPEPQAKKSPQPQPDGKPLADGIQWLLTNEAWKLAQRRGCRRGYASFSKHAKAHPDRLDVWGIRFLGITYWAHISTPKKAPIALQRILQRSSWVLF